MKKLFTLLLLLAMPAIAATPTIVYLNGAYNDSYRYKPFYTIPDSSGTLALVSGNIGNASASSVADATSAYTYTGLLVAQSASAVTAPVDTNLNTLATISLTGNTMGANGCVEITTLWSHTNSADSKVLTVSFGGTDYTAVTVTTSVTTHMPTIICNRAATNSQVGFVSGSNSGYGTSVAAKITSAVDTTAGVTILIKGQKSTVGASSLVLERYAIRAYR